MVASCAAWGCTNSQKIRRKDPFSAQRKSDITFHRFPLKNLPLLRKWEAALRRENYKAAPSHRICSAHFASTDYDDSGFRRKLKKDAVPSVFAYLPHLQKTAATPRRKIVRHQQDIRTPQSKALQRTSIKYAAKHDHPYSRDSAATIQTLTQRIGVIRKKNKTLKKKVRRAGKQREKLKNTIKELKDKNLIESAAHELLAGAFGGMSLTLFKHIMHHRNRQKNGHRFPDSVRKFAVTVHYLSSRAYDFIRPILKLPHPSVLRKWALSVDCQPGFLDNMLHAAKEMTKSGDNLCSLIVDEMSLRKEVVWCPSRHMYSGHLDFGGGPVNDSVASNALVFMLVSLTGRWKTPVAYFLTNHIDSETLAANIKQAILTAGDHDLVIKTVVADGLKANVKAGKLLECDISATSPKCWFKNPHHKYINEKVWFICDPPHMLKLFRNLLAEKQTIHSIKEDGTKTTISWHYVKSLHDLQSKDSLYLANKLRSRHIQYRNVKMKVNVAAQTLSASVATAIDHLRDDLHLVQFRGSEETCKCIRIIDQLFDLLNSKNPKAKDFKAPLGHRNIQGKKLFIYEAINYLLSLHDVSSIPLYQTPRGQAIVGFIVSATSALGLAQELLDSGRLQYLLTYKFNQDHIEMYFSKIRQRDGWNNNPTAEEFRFALRTLMMQNDIKASSHGNANPQDETQELSITYMLKGHLRNMLCAEQLSETFNFEDSDWRMSCLGYTAGFVCKRLQRQLKCLDCVSALTDDKLKMDGDKRFSFLQRRDNGGLLCPS